MLKVIKHIDIKGIKGKNISKAISDVIKEFDQRADVKKLKKIEVYVTKDPVKVCRQILFPKGKIKVKRHGEVREWICGNQPNFSYWERGKTPVIMLNATDKIFQGNNYNAIRGLVAHELMHLLNKLDGIEDVLRKEIEIAAQNILIYLDKHKEVKPFTTERLMVSLIRVTTTASLFIKDILANTRAMSFGFDDEIYDNYRIVLSDAKTIEYTKKGILNDLRKDKKHVLDDAFLVYVGLNMSWVAFKMFQNKWYKELKEMADIKIPKIIEKKGDEVLKELLNLRSGKDRETIAKILSLTQKNYYDVVMYFCERLRKK